MLGENFWGSQDETSVTFHDSAKHPVHPDPKVLHFRNATAIYVYEHLKMLGQMYSGIHQEQSTAANKESEGLPK